MKTGKKDRGDGPKGTGLLACTEKIRQRKQDKLAGE